MWIGNYVFVQTCGACPEQYDVFDKDQNQVGYVRLRWGNLYAQYPDVGGTTIYEADIGDGWTGSFKTEQQRVFHLGKIAEQIDKFSNYTCVDCMWSDIEDDYVHEPVLTCECGHYCNKNTKPCSDFEEYHC